MAVYSHSMSKMTQSEANNPASKNATERPPVVVVMGHIDHGKSTLLDYIRKSNIVDTEAGGITQHISAYEVVHNDEHGQPKKITFLDTPGHEAFSKMRSRGANAADIAILVVSAEDSVKAQTIEALNTILESKIPYIVAINKVDKPAANIEKTKIDLAEHGVYVEGYGGNIPVAEISAKTGQGIDTLLELILLVAELGEFTANPTKPASGYVIEAKLDPKRGMAATLLIKDGTLSKGMFVVVENSLTTTRIIEDFLGKQISEATFSSPIRIVGFDNLPSVGAAFTAYANKKDAERAVADWQSGKRSYQTTAVHIEADSQKKLIPLIIKSDVAGTTEAIEKEVGKLAQDTIAFKIISKGIGAISENDIRTASSDKNTIIAGFNVKLDRTAQELNEKEGVLVKTFDIIYKLTEWLAEEIEARRPRIETTEITGKVKVLKVFSRTKERIVAGGKVQEGKIVMASQVRIMRRDFEIGRGTIINLELNKIKMKEIEEGNEFGMMVETKIDLAGGDVLESFVTITK